jgi:hypothetical protein
MANTITLQPDENDAFDNFIHISTGISSVHTVLQVGHAAGTLVRTIMKWDLTSFSTRATRIISAKLTLTEHTDQVTTEQTVRGYRITEGDMTESATWTTYDGSTSWATAGGDYTTTPEASATVASTGGNLEMEDAGFIALVQDAVDNRNGYLSILLATQEELDGTTSGTERMKYHSSNAANSLYHPKLEITYEHVVHWTGGAGDGNLSTAGNWSTGAVPVAGDRVLFATGNDDITLGSLTGGIVCIGPKFKGGIGKPHNIVQAVTPLQFTADAILWHSADAAGSIESMTAGAVVYVMDSPSIAGDLVLTGQASKLVVGRTRSQHTFNIDAASLQAFSHEGNTTRMIMGAAFEGNVRAVGAGTRVELTTAAGNAGHLHATGAARIETAESGTTGFIVAGSGGRVGFNAQRIDESASWEQYSYMIASDPAASDGFGLGCGASGDTCVVGSIYDDDDGTDSGSAYVFIRSGLTWTQQAKLNGDAVVAGDWFGRNVDIDGDTIVVGCESQGSGTLAGSAYVFTRSGVTWTQQAKLTASDGAAGDEFGHDVQIDGDTIVVGALKDDDDGTDSGAAYIFTRSGVTWTQQAKLTADDAAAGDEFGNDVAISGDTVAIGAPDENADAGSVYIFTRSGVTWTQQQKLTASDIAAGDRFGGAVRLDGDTLLAAGWQNDDDGTNSGAAYVFTRSGTTWTEEAKLTGDDSAAGDNFGTNIDIAADTVAIGAWYDDDNGSNSGSAYVFTRSGTTWTQQAKLTPTSPAAGDNFGRSISLNTEADLLIGAPGSDIDTVGGGAGFWFKLAYTESLILDGRFDGIKNPNGDADVGGQLAVYHPGEAAMDSTTGGVGFRNGAIRCIGGGVSVGNDTTTTVE